MRWTFTINNPGPGDAPGWEPATMDYMVYQFERGNETGTEHIQGYVRFKNRRKFSVVQQWLPHGAHIEKARGSEQQNKDYCTKEDTRVAETVPREFGTFNGDTGHQGRRTDLAAGVEALKTGIPMTEFVKVRPI